MSRLGAKKTKAIRVMKAFVEHANANLEEGAVPEAFVDPRVIKIPEDGHVFGRPYVANLVKGLKENLPEEKQESAIAELEATLGQRFHQGGAAAGRLKRRLRRRLTKLDAQVAVETKNPMNSPNKALRRQLKLKQRAIKMSFMLVGLLIRSTWRYRGHTWTPTPIELPTAPVSTLDAYHQRIADRQTTIHPFERTVRLDADQLAKVAATIEEDRKAFKAALKQGNKLTIQAGEAHG